MWKMSDVRLSNGSPPLERVEARVPDHAKPPVCRNLFGTADPEEFKRDFEEQMQEIKRASEERWNYDFSRDAPLPPGQYVWEEVDGKDVPDFYTRQPRNAKRVPASGTVDHNGNSSCLLPAPSQENGGGSSEHTAAESRSDCRETTRRSGRKRPSTEEQDSASQSKRPNSDTEEANHCPDTSDSVEQTPKKSDPET